MIRKTFLMAATIFSVSFIAADSVWACKFLDNLCYRVKRACAPVYPCVTPCDAVCLPDACKPAGRGSATFEGGTLHVQPPMKPADKPVETPKEDIPEPLTEMTPAVPAEPATPATPPVAEPPAEKPVERDLTPAEPPVAEPPKAETPVAEPPKAESPVAEPPKAEPPVAEPPKTEPPVAEPPKTEPPVTEPPKAEPPAEPAKPEKGTEPEDSLFDAPPPKNVETPKEPEKEPAKEEAKEPAKEEAKEPAKEEAKEPVKEPAPPAEEKKDEKKEEKKNEKEEEPDLFSKSDAKEYRLWTDISGQFQVKAKFVGIVDGKVRLQKPNGKYVRIEMNQLCSIDQRLVEQIKSLASNW